MVSPLPLGIVPGALLAIIGLAFPFFDLQFSLSCVLFFFVTFPFSSFLQHVFPLNHLEFYFAENIDRLNTAGFIAGRSVDMRHEGLSVCS